MTNTDNNKDKPYQKIDIPNNTNNNSNLIDENKKLQKSLVEMEAKYQGLLNIITMLSQMIDNSSTKVYKEIIEKITDMTNLYKPDNVIPTVKNQIEQLDKLPFEQKQKLSDQYRNPNKNQQQQPQQQ